MAARLKPVLLLFASLLAAAGTTSWWLSGVRFAVGPIHISATEPAKVFLQASVAALLATLLPGRKPTPYVLPTFIVLVAVVVCATATSQPRRVGDGAEYVAMALNMRAGGLPALTPADLRRVSAELERTPGFADALPLQPLPGRDRRDFVHFWLYPLIATPAVFAATAVGVHVNYGFLLTNAALVTALAWMLVRAGHGEVAAMAVVGPILWWTDKAHAEPFIFATLGFAGLSLHRAPGWALIATGAAAAQNPAALVVLAIFTVAAVARSGWTRPTVTAVAGGWAVAAIQLLYSSWRFGMLTPLASGTVLHVPGVRALITPLVDPNLGLVVYAPVLCALAVYGCARPATDEAAGASTTTLLVACGALLVVFAQTVNVSHGGTPGMSRYGVWLLALLLPLVVRGCARLRAQAPRLLPIVASASVLLSLYLFHPDYVDIGSGPVPNRLASLLWQRWPAIDNPLPEIFAERLSGHDGAAGIPVATRGCENALVSGDGSLIRWPTQCETHPVPDLCRRKGALCYANGRTNPAFSAAPKQPGFRFELLPGGK